MSIHEMETLSYEDALSLLETRLVDIREEIDRTREKIERGEYGGEKKKMQAEVRALMQDRAEIEERMEKLRARRVEALSGGSDTLLTETLGIFDRIGERIDKLFGK